MRVQRQCPLKALACIFIITINLMIPPTEPCKCCCLMGPLMLGCLHKHVVSKPVYLWCGGVGVWVVRGVRVARGGVSCVVGMVVCVASEYIAFHTHKHLYIHKHVHKTPLCQRDVGKHPQLHILAVVSFCSTMLEIHTPQHVLMPTQLCFSSTTCWL